MSQMSGKGRQRGSRRHRAWRPVAVASAGLLTAALATVLFALLARDTGQRLLSPLPAVPSDYLVCALAVAGALLTTWIGLGVVTTALSAVPGAVGRVARVVADRVAPAAVRRGVAFLLGTALVASFAPGAAAGSPVGPDQPGSGLGTTGSLVIAAPLPDLRPASAADAPDPSLRPDGAVASAAGTATAAPTSGTPTSGVPASASSSAAPTSAAPTSAAPSAPAPPPSATPATPATPSGSASLGALAPSAPRPSLAPAARPVTAEALPSTTEFVVVGRGDTLWDIAAAHLGSGATTASIATEWQRWYAVNKALIGGDPDLIRPGQRLVAPSPLHRTAPTAPTAPTASTAPTAGAAS